MTEDLKSASGTMTPVKLNTSLKFASPHSLSPSAVLLSSSLQFYPLTLPAMPITTYTVILDLTPDCTTSLRRLEPWQRDKYVSHIADIVCGQIRYVPILSISTGTLKLNVKPLGHVRDSHLPSCPGVR